MSDVNRSDSQRSNTSLKPRVSFNKDVHVKRFGVPTDKFSSLPVRGKQRKKWDTPQQDGINNSRRHSDEINLSKHIPPKAPLSNSETILKSKPPKVKRSASDTSGLKVRILEKFHRKRTDSDSKCDETTEPPNKFGLYPIVEVSPPCDNQITSDDLFRTEKNKNQKNANTLTRNRKTTNVEIKNTAKKNLNNENSKVKRFIPTKAVQIKNKLFKNSDKKNSDLLTNEFEYKTTNKTKKKPSKETRDARNNIIRSNNNLDDTDEYSVDESTIKGDKLVNKKEETAKMLHGSQQSRGHQVSTMVRRLTKERAPPPPMSKNILVTPSVGVAHNNNQPFSYTQPASFDKIHSPTREIETPKPVIYAQVVVNNTDNESGSHKQTIHTTYTSNGKIQIPYSDSDEGLGYEDTFPKNKKLNGHRRHLNQSIEDDEYPITPKFKYNNGNFPSVLSSSKYSPEEPVRSQNNNNNNNNNSFIQITGDDLDSPRKFHTNGYNSYGYEHKQINDKNNLSHRRDLLESRINSRRIEKRDNNSHEFGSIHRNGTNFSRNENGSPDSLVNGFETNIKRTTNSQKYADLLDRKPSFESEDGYIPYNNDDFKRSELRESYPDQNGRSTHKSSYIKTKETRSFDTSKNKYKNEKMVKDQSHYKSNPEINGRNYDDHDRFTSETYHDSLRRQKQKSRSREFINPKNEYVEYVEERRDKFVDSGIENDLRRDSGENNKGYPSYIHNSRLNNESDDEGFVSSLLIASERQHTETNFGTRGRRYDKEQKADYRLNASTSNLDYVHRERSIDDGSHFDPRIDKDLGQENGKKTLKKTTKSTKIGTIEKMKQLFTRDVNKKSKKANGPNLAREESLRARYKEYKGSNELLNRTSNSVKSTKTWESNKQTNGRQDRKIRSDHSNDNSQCDITPRKRLSTPRTSPTRYSDTANNNHSTTTTTTTTTHESSRNGNGNKSFEKWFKSLDRFSNKKDKMEKDKSDLNESKHSSSIAQAHAKNLCYFGDTDMEPEETLNHRNRSESQKNLTPITVNGTRSQSTRNLHHGSPNDSDKSIPITKNYKSMQNISETEVDNRGSRVRSKPPILSNSKQNTLKSRSSSQHNRKKGEISSLEGSTEGEGGSQQSSQRSVVYLHKATVGDIPNPRSVSKIGRRAFSKHDLSNKSPRMQTQVKTLSRSFSVLAPWTPHHGNEIHYNTNTSDRQKSPNKESSTNTYQKKKVTHTTSLGNNSKSKENISDTMNRRSKDDAKGLSTTTLYRKKVKQPKENTSRFNRSEKNIASKSMSIESLGADKGTLKKKDKSKGVSRSVSMPYDTEKSAGWFKKSNRNANDSHRL